MIPIVGSCLGDLVKEAVKTKGVVGIAICGYLPSVVFSSYEWNPSGSGLFYDDLPIALSYVTDEATIEEVEIMDFLN